VSDKIDVKGGPESNVQITFDGEALELVGYTATVLHLPKGKLRLKRKKKPEKDGGQVMYFVHPLSSSRIEIYFKPEDLAGMEKLVDALLAADVDTF